LKYKDTAKAADVRYVRSGSGGGEEGGRGPQEKKDVKETCAKGFFGLSRG
jgi:hypothetical protein